MTRSMAGRKWQAGVSRKPKQRTRKMPVCFPPYDLLPPLNYVLNILTQYTGLATQLALAYAIHKSFIFIRVPIAAAVTPRIVKMLRGWGWDIGKRTTKEAKALKRAALPPKKPRRKLISRKQGNGS